MIDVLHISDPGCPWAYSAAPAHTALRWRYGDSLRWRHAMIGLADDGAEYERRGYTPARRALGNLAFRTCGMPFSTEPPARIPGTGLACRAVIATRLLAPEREWEVFRTLQRAWFTTPALLDEPDALTEALGAVLGLDVSAVVAALDGLAAEAYAQDRALARSAAGSPSEAQEKTTDRSGGQVRYTAPSLIFERDGRRLEAGGFQPLSAYEVCLVNLDPAIERRRAPDDVRDLLLAFPDGLTTREVARCLAADNDEPDDGAAEAALIEAVAGGGAERRPIGDGALWRAAG